MESYCWSLGLFLPIICKLKLNHKLDNMKKFENSKQLVACIAVIGIITALFALMGNLYAEHIIVLVWAFALVAVAMVLCRKRRDVILTLALLAIINLGILIALWGMMPTWFFATVVPLGIITTIYAIILAAVFDREKSACVMAVWCGCILLYFAYFAYAGSTLVEKLPN